MITIIIIYAGIVGSGKTLRAVIDGYQGYKRGENCYSNQYIEYSYQLPLNWYDYRYPFGSFLIIDEAQLKYNCRNFNNKQKLEQDEKILAFLTMCRHYDIDILFITQSLSRLDVQIRELATIIYRFKKTIKIPYFSFKDKKIKWLPILQIGKVFDDEVELEHFMNSVDGAGLGRLFLRFVNFKCLKMYDTHILDFDYISKPEVENLIHQKNYWHGYLVM